ncbi:WbqC family protein [Streptomyces sp. cg2]|uniref:WbqC family protein n=1 Tax=Streptomyces sp. cg2 TaxID=3238799 RepID=UPI0034E282A4
MGGPPSSGTPGSTTLPWPAAERPGCCGSTTAPAPTGPPSRRPWARCWTPSPPAGTATVAEISTRVLLDLLGWKGQILTSSQLPSRPGRSVRLADLSAATGARAYLCGTGGMTYLDPAPFAARNIAVAPFRPPLINICSSGRQPSALWALAALGPDAVADRLQALAAVHTVLQPAA